MLVLRLWIPDYAECSCRTGAIQSFECLRSQNLHRPTTPHLSLQECQLTNDLIVNLTHPTTRVQTVRCTVFVCIFAILGSVHMYHLWWSTNIHKPKSKSWGHFVFCTFPQWLNESIEEILRAMYIFPLGFVKRNLKGRRKGSFYFLYFWELHMLIKWATVEGFIISSSLSLADIAVASSRTYPSGAGLSYRRVVLVSPPNSQHTGIEAGKHLPPSLFCRCEQDANYH